jgi:drug/metabolite transporter (DMT)-like permease
LSSAKADGATLLGDLLVYCASFTFALYTVRGKRESSRLGGVVVNTFAYVGTAVAMLPITIGYSVGFTYSNVTWVAWASLLYMAVFPSVICYSIYYYALTYVPASRVSAFSYLQPLLATVMAIPLLGEHPTKSLIMGGGLVLTGVFLAERG